MTGSEDGIVTKRLLASQAGNENFEQDPAYCSGKTTVEILNHEQDGNIYIDSYSQIGFRLNSGLRVMGPCAIFPRSVLHWNVRGVEDVSEDSLSLFTMLEPKLDLLVLGVGERENLGKINFNILKFLKSKRINVEILSTDQALATFNFLNSEKRFVAGAFIPPSYVESNYGEDEYFPGMSRVDGPFEAEQDYDHIRSDAHDKLPSGKSDGSVGTSMIDKIYNKEQREKDKKKHPQKYLD